MRMPQRANEDWQRYCRPMLHSELFLQTERFTRSHHYVAPNNKQTKGSAAKDPAEPKRSVEEDDFVWGMASSLGLCRKSFRGGRKADMTDRSACGEKDNRRNKGRTRKRGGKEKKTEGSAFQNTEVNQRQLLLLMMKVVGQF